MEQACPALMNSSGREQGRGLLEGRGPASAGSWGPWFQSAEPLRQNPTHRGLKRLTFIAHSSGGQEAPRSRHGHVCSL